jgi:hypothetical protein
MMTTDMWYMAAVMPMLVYGRVTTMVVYGSGGDDGGIWQR